MTLPVVELEELLLEELPESRFVNALPTPEEDDDELDELDVLPESRLLMALVPLEEPQAVNMAVAVSNRAGKMYFFIERFLLCLFDSAKMRNTYDICKSNRRMSPFYR